MKKKALQELADLSRDVLKRLQMILPPPRDAQDWTAPAFKWHKKSNVGYLTPVHGISAVSPEDLLHIERQKEAIERNTRHFLQGKPANNVLMTGARGTGKSSLVKAMLHQYAGQGLRVIEVDKSELTDLPEIIEYIADRPERFIIFCDDLSFEEGESSYKTLKTILDGSLADNDQNVLIYATSNRRHLLPERYSENATTQYQADGEVHPGDVTEEKLSLSDRFGLWLTFYPLKQDDYLDIVYHWLERLGCPAEHIESSRLEALQWATQRGSRSARIARHFAKDWTARHLD